MLEKAAMLCALASARCGSRITSCTKCGGSTRKVFEMKYIIVSVLASILAFSQTPSPSPSSAPDPDFFENKVRPVLAENCYDCHTAAEMGGLRVDSRDRLLEGGKSRP